MKGDRVLGMIGMARKAGLLAMGVNLSMEAVRSGRADLLVVARDAAKNAAAAAAKAQADHRIDTICYAGKEELGRAVGKPAISILAVCDKGMAGQIKKLYGEKVWG
jgi:ribosomal protein L7Ae-like RNA K-turn-binding protein